jgi:hypothetical protein
MSNVLKERVGYDLTIETNQLLTKRIRSAAFLVSSLYRII